MIVDYAVAIHVIIIKLLHVDNMLTYYYLKYNASRIISV